MEVNKMGIPIDQAGMTDSIVFSVTRAPGGCMFGICMLDLLVIIGIIGIGAIIIKKKRGYIFRKKHTEFKYGINYTGEANE